MESYVDTLIRLESVCLKSIAIVEAVKEDLHTLRSYLSMVEFVDGGIVVDEDTNSELKIEELLNEDDGVIRIAQLSDESLREEVHDYCSHHNEEIHKGLIYNEPENDGKPVEVAYIVPENIFLTLPESYSPTHFAFVPFSFLISSSSLSSAFLVFMLFNSSARSSVLQEFEAKRPEPKHPDYVGPQYKHFVVSELRCFLYWDEPAAKPTFKITLEVPTELMALYNMPVCEDHYEGNLKTVTLQKSPIMCIYLVVLVIGLFDYVEDHTPEGIKVRVYCHVGKQNQGTFSLDVAVKSLGLYKDYFATPYPVPKLDIIALPDFVAGAMDYYGLVRYCESTFFYDEKHSTAANKHQVGIVAHELAHQWFGNIVSMQWWTHIWLNEGLATWLADDAVCIGETPSNQSYLVILNVLAATLSRKCTMFHPGYGFLAENVIFLNMCKSLISFIGPHSNIIHVMGDKATTGDTMKRVGVPTVPGSGRLFLFLDSNIWTQFFMKTMAAQKGLNPNLRIPQVPMQTCRLGGSLRTCFVPIFFSQLVLVYSNGLQLIDQIVIMSSRFVILADKDLSRREE